MKARDIMSSPPIVVQPATKLKEIVNLLREHRINSVPVVDTDSRVVGIVSRRELFLQSKRFRSPELRVPVLFREVIDPKEIPEIYKKAAHLSAKNVMAPVVLTVKETDDVGDVAWRMAELDAYLALVMRESTLVGVISRSDLIRLLAQEDD